MEWLGLVGSIMAIIGLTTALLDMGMNGARYAGWAPYGVGMALVGLSLVWVSGG